MGDSANPEVQVELSDLSFTRAEKTSTTSGVQELVGWNGCESRGSDWKVKAGTPYKRNSNHQLTAEGKTLEKLADCGAPLNLIPDRDCSSDKLSPRMARFLDEHLFSCVKQAAHASGLKEEPKRVFVITGECFIDRKMRGASQISEHATGNACDIYAFQLIGKDGRVSKIFDTNINNHFPNQLPASVREQNARCEKSNVKIGAGLNDAQRQSNRAFYDEFRTCWSAAGGRSFGYESPKGPPSKKIGLNNRLHNDHLHIEGPSE